MTIQPEHVRFAFGTSVRTYDGPATPQAIIAPIFRDVGQPDTGLTQAVEEIAGAAMKRMARGERHQPRDVVSFVKPAGTFGRPATMRTGYAQKLLERLAEGPFQMKCYPELLDLKRGRYLRELVLSLNNTGLIRGVEGERLATYAITDAGRAWLAEQQAAASQGVAQ